MPPALAPRSRRGRRPETTLAFAVASWVAVAVLALGAAPPRKPANVMGMEGAAWLEREGRDREEKPEVVLQAMALREGMKVAEIGAGTGYFSRRIAKQIGPQGKVYAVDIQPGMLDLLRQYAAKEGITNIETVVSAESDPKLPPRGVDRILLVDVYHEFQRPRPMLEKISQALAPGGRVILVEYRAEDDSAKHINAAHRMSVTQVLAEWGPAGFELVDRLETLPSQHLFVFTNRRGARAPGAEEAPRPPG
jgi:ubiquinone/menaquinone biosynthesis C-methylase UbiE